MKEKLDIGPGVEGYASFIQQPFPRRESHRHEELEMNLVLTGAAAYLMGRERVPLVAGSMIWLFPKQEHMLIDCTPDFSTWVLVFKTGLVRRQTRAKNRAVLRARDPGAIYCRQIEPGAVETLHQVCLNAAQEDHDLANTALAYVLLASWQAFQVSRLPVISTDVHPAVARAARLLVEEEPPASLDGLALKAGLSAPWLSRLFKKQTGISVTAFRQRKCLERFLRLYRKGSRYTLIQAALGAGFGSYPQFHRIFRSLMGESPGAYARRIKAGPFLGQSREKISSRPPDQTPHTPAHRRKPLHPSR